MAIVLALSLLLLSQSVSQAAKPTRDNTPPTVGTVVPANNETDVAVTRNVEATFSEAMKASTINGSTFTLAKAGTTTPVAAQVTYDPATITATLNPNADLDPGAKYTATVKNGVKDLANNPLANSSTWSFTTVGAPPPTGDTTPPDTTIDSGPSATVTSTSSSASFTFSSSEPNSTFECKLDLEAYSTCASPKAYSGLADGSHTFYVRATDAAGNVDASDASRKWMIDTTTPPPTSTKIVALTFDDGPDPTNTRTILDILKSNNVKATFFVNGRRVNQYPDLVRMEYAEGHSVQNHSQNHYHMTTLSDSQVRQELVDTNTAIVNAGAPQPVLFRPPYGETNATIESIATSLGLTQVLWDVASGDAQFPSSSSQTICDRVLNGVQPGSVVIQHDYARKKQRILGAIARFRAEYRLGLGLSTNTVAALPCIITGLKNQGYSFSQIYPSPEYNSSAQGYVVVR
jgi:peptidoglycan/xylan/chitin deacetylase (PgdA/CDA1 family)